MNELAPRRLTGLGDNGTNMALEEFAAAMTEKIWPLVYQHLYTELPTLVALSVPPAVAGAWPLILQKIKNEIPGLVDQAMPLAMAKAIPLVRTEIQKVEADVSTIADEKIQKATKSATVIAALVAAGLGAFAYWHYAKK